MKLLITSMAIAFGLGAQAQTQILSDKLKQTKLAAAELRRLAPDCTTNTKRLFDTLSNPIDQKLDLVSATLESEIKNFGMNPKCYRPDWANYLATRYSAVVAEFQKSLPPLNSNEGNILWGLDGSKPAEYPKCTLDIPKNKNSTPATYAYIRLKQQLFGQGLAVNKGLPRWTIEGSPAHLLSVISSHVQKIKGSVCNSK